MPTAPAGTLIGSTDGGATWFAIGAGPTTVSGPGELLLAADDYSPSAGNCGLPAPTGCYSDNSGAVTASITPLYGFSGFLPPISNAPTVNSGKAGRTYPVKFQLTDASGQFVTSPSAVSGVSVETIACGSLGADPSTIDSATTTGGTSLRYDSTANQYVFNWSTPAATGCYQLSLSLDTGQVETAYFNLS